MKYYKAEIQAFQDDDRIVLMSIILEAPCMIEAYVSAAHSYRLSVPEKLKQLDPSIYIEDVTDEIMEVIY